LAKAFFLGSMPEMASISSLAVIHALGFWVFHAAHTASALSAPSSSGSSVVVEWKTSAWAVAPRVLISVLSAAMRGAPVPSGAGLPS
jgi:hypothetical protein